MNRYSIALGKKGSRIKSIPKPQKKTRVKFTCGTCEHLLSKYVGDGFDEFYEWKCRAAELRLIGHDEPFARCERPAWCPKIKNVCTYKDHTRDGRTRPFRCKKCGRLFHS
jgi:hypothetical protein